MKKFILMMVAILTMGMATAADVTIQRHEYGSGTPGTTGVENAVPVGNNLYFAPQYMPGFPTAAQIYPRVIDVPCTMANDVLNCDGYNWLPSMGRAEYLLIKPVIKK